MSCCGKSKVPTPPDSIMTKYVAAGREPHIKVILLGDTSVGKSSLLLRMTQTRFVELNVPTVGVDMQTILLDVADRKVKATVWDTAGQERFRTIVRSYYRDTHAVIAMFSLVDAASFASLPHWIHEARETSPDTAVLIVGCKSDLAEQKPELHVDVAALSQVITNEFKYIETSARTGQGVSMVRTFLEGVADTYLQQQASIGSTHVKSTT